MMSLFSILLSLSIITLLVSAAPTPANIALARRYAPQFRFHKDEIYFPSTVEYFLAGVGLKDSNGGSIGGSSPITVGAIGGLQNSGSGLFLSTDLEQGKRGFLRGQNPSTTSTATYAFIAPKANGIVDLYYWIFCPFNLAKNVWPIGEVGDHVGDWERITVRTVNGVATQVDYHAHSDTGSGTIPWAQIPKFDNDQRPAAYVAKGSHGLWSKAGTFTYLNALIFKLQDETSDNGVSWDTKDSLITINYPDTYSDSLAWLNFKGIWGNKGQTNCWWYAIHPECANVDGPNGPLRDDVLGAAKVAGNTLRKGSMLGPLSQTLAEVSSNPSSEFTFYSDASSASYKFISVEQQCRLFNETSSTYEEAVSQYSSTALSTQQKYTVSVPACADGSVVSSYSLGLCVSSEQQEGCSWSVPRQIRAFSADIEGVQDSTAVIVDDLDVWKLV